MSPIITFKIECSRQRSFSNRGVQRAIRLWRMGVSPNSNLPQDRDKMSLNNWGVQRGSPPMADAEGLGVSPSFQSPPRGGGHRGLMIAFVNAPAIAY